MGNVLFFSPLGSQSKCQTQFFDVFVADPMQNSHRFSILNFVLNPEAVEGGVSK